MTSLFDRLHAEESFVLGELAVLRDKAAAMEERLVHLSITRETARSLMDEERVADCAGPGPQEHGTRRRRQSLGGRST